jgi:hypothetical protein
LGYFYFCLKGQVERWSTPIRYPDGMSKRHPSSPATLSTVISPDARVFGGLKSLRLAIAEDDHAAIGRRSHRLVHGYADDPPELRGEMTTERGDSAFMVASWRAPFEPAALVLADAGADTGRRNELGLSVFMSMARDTWRGQRTIRDLAQFLDRYKPDPKTPSNDVKDNFFSSGGVPAHIEGFLRYPMASLDKPHMLDDMENVARHVAFCHRVEDLEQWWMTVQRSGSQLPNMALGRSELWGIIVTERVQKLLLSAGEDASYSSSVTLPEFPPKARPVRRL